MGGIQMTDYKKLYHLLFNAITDALDGIDRLELTAAVQRLKDAQIQAEELVIDGGENGSAEEE